MTEIENILSEVEHRPFQLPSGRWAYYQEWNNALFLHWKVPYDLLRQVVPKELNIDTFDGEAYISLVVFTMQKIRPKYFPSVKFVSDFEEINLRTYIDNDDKKGVYFLNIEGAKLLSVFIAKMLSGLPYEKANIIRTKNTCKSVNRVKNFHLETEFLVNTPLTTKTELDKWLTERYCLYLNQGIETYRYDIHHKEWDIKDVELKRLNLKYKTGLIDLENREPDLVHYSEGVKVIAWNKISV